MPQQLKFLYFLLKKVFLHALIPDHWGSLEDVFMKIHRSPEHPFIVERLFGGLDNWDAEYFIFNAHSGYGKHEQTMAFFPLLPAAMWTVSKTLLFPLSYLMPQRSVLLISGALVNLLAFPLTAVTLYLLTLELSHNKKLSLLTAGLFCINPAGVFMSAVYSETLFALFTFSGLLALEKKWAWLGTIAFSLSSLARSNGVVLCGFLGYRCLSAVLSTLLSRADLSARQRVYVCVKQVLAAVLQCVVTVAPFVGFQYYGYTLYCTEPSSDGLSTPPVWCNATVPFPYSFIQRQYWNVGFLRYYQWKQLPNFILASPVVILTLFSAGCYFSGRRTDRKRQEVDAVPKYLFWSPRLRPYVVHMLFLLTFGVLNMHIQVKTVISFPNMDNLCTKDR